ncbi:cytochrome-c oxidase [Corynebacterium poyangense]|uniref:Cytochrome c oxidase polypeptide 4 n=1 Tax=Corynebacterium poyangense TaxID=2684405 RepID=A0A7H0SPV8_9CORY|nr:cytochrome c oxidase subunit 4 [Corynebacterium poyangense]MBZ8178176.1 cytochrome-c oxidase [Corynebacterium poyangense]QNQ90583.1 cytochrome-c oxidase [Corynebacterium poyangense]
MNPGAKIMYGTAVFLALMSVIYIFATTMVSDGGNPRGLEWAGTVALILACVLAIMLGGYLHLTSNRSDVLPEDWEEAEVADKAGTLGFFSPHSIWPAAMAGAIMVLGLGIAFLHWWLLILGAVLLIYTTTMLNLQYGLPKEKH